MVILEVKSQLNVKRVEVLIYFGSTPWMPWGSLRLDVRFFDKSH